MSKIDTCKPGLKFGMMKVISEPFRIEGQLKVNCICECGTSKVIHAYHLINGKINSCGCTRYAKGTKHSAWGTRLYNCWQGMKERCRSKHGKNFRNYGSKGIIVCEEWQLFEPFRDWALSNGYADNLTLDRIEGKGNYEPSNCRWATWEEQNNNLQRNKPLTFMGKTQNVNSWTKELGFKYSTIGNRLRYGWTVDQALSTPEGIHLKDLKNG